MLTQYVNPQMRGRGSDGYWLIDQAIDELMAISRAESIAEMHNKKHYAVANN